jgi:hypothetical protein
VNSEETVELTPGADAKGLAQQLLAVAADTGNPYRVDDVKTTTSGPLGLAFLVPRGLYDAWQSSLGIPVEAEAVEEPTETAAPKRGNRNRKTAAGGEE